MKVRVLAGSVAVAMLVGVGSAAAQTSMEYGVKVGPNFSTVTGNPAGTGAIIKKNMKIDVTFGGQIIVPATPLIAFQPEFLYQRVGVKVEDLTQAVPPEVTAHVDLFEIPLLLRVGRKNDTRGYYVLAGPTIDFITRAKTTSDAAVEGTGDFKDELKSTVFGLSFGVGVTMKAYFIEYRYTMGLNDVNKDPDPLDPDNKVKSQSSAILVGYSFGGKK